jgi:hypothetical protein
VLATASHVPWRSVGIARTTTSGSLAAPGMIRFDHTARSAASQRSAVPRSSGLPS